MKILAVKTRAFLPPRDNLFTLLDKYLPALKEADVLCVASKILAISQGRCKKLKTKSEKLKIIKQEADYYLPKLIVGGSDIVLTIKKHTLIPSAGVDESNGNGYLILWPKNPSRLCRQICAYLKKKQKIKKLAVIAVDSHTTPLRWGTVGISIGFFGLVPLCDYRGKKDVFGRKLKYTQSNIVDALAVMAVLTMGEGRERTPLAIIRGLKNLKFTNQATHRQLVIPPKKDLYWPLLKIFKQSPK